MTTPRLVLPWLAPLLLVIALLLPATAAAADPAEFWKFHVVGTGADGRPEQLRDIAAQFLGDGDRHAELAALNIGRRQPDGGTLDGTEQLRTGWIIALPWDAAGPGIRYGVLPGSAGTPAPETPETPEAPGTPAETCPQSETYRPAPDGLPWAQLRFNLNGAWTRTRGAGVAVAVIDTGVDADADALHGRVHPGDAAGDEAAIVDCTGHGTAMAGIVAAAADRDGGFSGMAPESEIVPIRVTPWSASSM